MNLHDFPSLHASCITPFCSLQKDKTERQKDKTERPAVFFEPFNFIGFFPSFLLKKTKRQLKKVITGVEKNVRNSATQTEIAWSQCFSLGLSFCLKDVKSITYMRSVVSMVCLFGETVFLNLFGMGERA